MPLVLQLAEERLVLAVPRAQHNELRARMGIQNMHFILNRCVQ